MIAYDLSQDQMQGLGLELGDIPDKGVFTSYEVTKDRLTIIPDQEIPNIPSQLKQPLRVFDRRTSLEVDTSSMNVGDIANMDVSKFVLRIGER